MMVIWQGRLDDAIETLEYENSERARELRAQTKEYVAQLLQLVDASRERATSAALGFQPVAQVVCKHYDGGRRTRDMRAKTRWTDRTDGRQTREEP